MEKNISIIGSGQTKFGEHWNMSLLDLMREAMEKAIDEAPCGHEDIDLVIVANMLGEAINDQAHLGSLASELLPHHPPALRVESACGSGAMALHTACAYLESGRAKTVLVIGAEKMTDVSNEVVSESLMGAADSEEDRPVGLTFPGIFGLIASRYMHEYGLTRDDLSLVSAVHHRNAAANPFAQFRNAIAPEIISQSAPVSDPLRLLDCSPISDGAAACILSTSLKSPVRIAASQIASAPVSLAHRKEITHFTATEKAMEKALAEAEIGRIDLSCLEIHDCFSIAAIINLEDLGFAGRGEGVEVYRKLWERDHGSLRVNESGGLKGCGHPVAATGVKQVNDIRKQLLQNKSRYGLAHNFGGACASCAVHILEYQR